MLIDRTDDPMMRLLIDATRRAETPAAALAGAHRKVGEALAPAVAQHVSLEDVEIDHVKGKSTGVRVAPNGGPIFIAMLRAGLFIAEGMWESIPGSALVLFDGVPNSLVDVPVGNRLVVIVDAVINTGKSLQPVLQHVQSRSPAKLVVATLVGYRPTVETLAESYPAVDFLAGRLSERSYVGSGTTDTGSRLFGTTHW